MGMQINHNIRSMNAFRNLNNNSNMLSKSLEKLSSGFRINRAADDAAGLAISESLRSHINGLKRATSNAQDGISVIQTAEGALNETHALLQRVRDLAVQASNVGANDQNARDAIGDEVQQALNEIDRIGQATMFGTTQLIQTNQSFTFHVGAGTQSYNQISVSISSAMAQSGLGLTAASVVAQITAGSAGILANIDSAITTVSSMRSRLGAFQNRLENTISNLSVAAENLASSESRIRDADMALEMAGFTRNQILVQASTSMLAQANSSPQSVLQLLG